MVEVFQIPIYAASAFPKASVSLQLSVCNTLLSLRNFILNRDFPATHRVMIQEHIISTKQVESLVLYCRGVLSKAHLLKVPGFNTNKKHFDKYGDEISHKIIHVMQNHLADVLQVHGSTNANSVPPANNIIAPGIESL